MGGCQSAERWKCRLNLLTQRRCVLADKKRRPDRKRKCVVWSAAATQVTNWLQRRRCGLQPAANREVPDGGIGSGRPLRAGLKSSVGEWMPCHQNGTMEGAVRRWRRPGVLEKAQKKTPSPRSTGSLSDPWGFSPNPPTPLLCGGGSTHPLTPQNWPKSKIKRKWGGNRQDSPMPHPLRDSKTQPPPPSWGWGHTSQVDQWPERNEEK